MTLVLPALCFLAVCLTFRAVRHPDRVPGSGWLRTQRRLTAFYGTIALALAVATILVAPGERGHRGSGPAGAEPGAFPGPGPEWSASSEYVVVGYPGHHIAGEGYGDGALALVGWVPDAVRACGGRLVFTSTLDDFKGTDVAIVTVPPGEGPAFAVRFAAAYEDLAATWTARARDFYRPTAAAGGDPEVQVRVDVDCARRELVGWERNQHLALPGTRRLSRLFEPAPGTPAGARFAPVAAGPAALIDTLRAKLGTEHPAIGWLGDHDVRGYRLQLACPTVWKGWCDAGSAPGGHVDWRPR